MRRVLLLAPFPPRLDAAHGGGRVVASLVCGLSARNRLGLVYMRAPEDRELDDALRGCCEIVDEITLPASRSPFRRRLTRIAKLWGAPPDRVARVYAPGCGERIRSLVESWRPDVVQAEFGEMGQYLAALDGLPIRTIIVDHDPGEAAALDFSRTATGLRRMSRRLDAIAWKRFSRKVLPRADAVVVFTQRDRDQLGWLEGDAVVTTIPLGVEAASVSPEPPAERPTVLFFGSYRHAPNSDAALRLMQMIMPCVRAHHPGAVLELVGADPTPEMTALAGDGSVVHGLVPSIEPYLARAWVVAAPIRLGGGMRMKVLESLAAGKAVVASPRAVEGLDVDGGDFLRVAESDDDFCATISNVLADSALREELGRNARDWAMRHLDPASVTVAFERLYGELDARSE